MRENDAHGCPILRRAQDMPFMVGIAQIKRLVPACAGMTKGIGMTFSYTVIARNEATKQSRIKKRQSQLMVLPFSNFRSQDNANEARPDLQEI